MKIGHRLHQLRKDKGLTLEELSSKSGVALATLSRMENNKMPGTLKSHISICKALDVSIAELYRELEDENKTVEAVPHKKRTEHFVHSAKAKYELLVMKALDKKIMPLMMLLGPGGSTQEEQTKPGIEKFVYVISGSFDAHVGEDKYTLRKGDSLYFDASLKHRFVNASKADAEAICVLSPPAL
ncbi:MAG: XRE family transcriptional regulator [Candidatus Omnitrophica bacterium]|nr:XRE family transcriptional regulator [Patescibacteria group bacterium]MDD5487940.1 XRE family transcriptional regulator [Candidatus Omnitrophota bacterium]